MNAFRGWTISKSTNWRRIRAGPFHESNLGPRKTTDWDKKQRFGKHSQPTSTQTTSPHSSPQFQIPSCGSQNGIRRNSAKDFRPRSVFSVRGCVWTSVKKTASNGFPLIRPHGGARDRRKRRQKHVTIPTDAGRDLAGDWLTCRMSKLRFRLNWDCQPIAICADFSSCWPIKSLMASKGSDTCSALAATAEADWLECARSDWSRGGGFWDDPNPWGRWCCSGGSYQSWSSPVLTVVVRMERIPVCFFWESDVWASDYYQTNRGEWTATYSPPNSTSPGSSATLWRGESNERHCDEDPIWTTQGKAVVFTLTSETQRCALVLRHDFHATKILWFRDLNIFNF